MQVSKDIVRWPPAETNVNVHGTVSASEMMKDCEELSEIQIPLNTEDEIPLVATQKRRRGKAIEWRFVKKFPTLDEARAEFSRGNLVGNEQFLGRKYTGKTSAIYINCQKVICGCNKKWRLVSSQSHAEVTLEETLEDHSNHEFFLRGGGNGLNSSQIKVTQEALLQNSRMKPLQILHFFRDRAAREYASGNRTVHYVIPHSACQVVLLFHGSHLTAK